jgi:peptidoglycan/xylan/chitin deacetylase (PgdA/CDA1 family)
MGVSSLGDAAAKITEFDARLARLEQTGKFKQRPSFIPPTRDTKVQTIFDSGHGFTAAAPSSGSQADDSSVFLLGSQSVRLTTTGASGVQATRKTGMTALDASSSYLAVTVRVDHPERLSSLRLDVSSDTFTNWSSYEAISPSTNAIQPLLVANEWVTLLCPWAAFAVGGGAGATRNALTGFQVRCTDNGAGPIQMWVNKISLVAEPANAVCVLTFDDGWGGVYTKAKPYMDKYGFRGVWAPIISKMGITNYMTLAQNQALYAAGWECAVHAADVAKHNNYLTISDTDAITDALTAQKWLRDNGFGPADNFLIPEGALSSETRRAQWAQQFDLCRLSYNRQRETYPPARPYGLRTAASSTSHTASDVTAKIDEAISSKELLILQIHNIVDVVTGDVNDTTTADFQTIIDYLNTNSVKVRTLADITASGVA